MRDIKEDMFILEQTKPTLLLRSRSGRSHATLPVPIPMRGHGERCVTPARAAAKETKATHNYLDNSKRYSAY